MIPETNIYIGQIRDYSFINFWVEDYLNKTRSRLYYRPYSDTDEHFDVSTEPADNSDTQIKALPKIVAQIVNDENNYVRKALFFIILKLSSLIGLICTIFPLELTYH